MIEQQTIDGREAVVSYFMSDFTPADKDNFDYAKVIFSDGEMVLVAGDGPSIEDIPDGSTGNVADIPVKIQLVAWQKAVIVLDASEILVRDLIERGLAGMTGPATEYRPKRSADAVDALITEIAGVRVAAIKTAFRLLRDRLNNAAVLETSLAKWAAYFAAQDIKAIDAAIRAGLVDGADNIEIARKVVGSMALNGVDGVTELTRLKIAHLGRASIKSFNLRKFGETQGAFDHTKIN